jgi:hypothetical protein
MHGTLIAVLTLFLLFQTSQGIGAEMQFGEISAETDVLPLAPLDHLVTNIVLTPPTPNILALNQNVTFTFNYSTTEPGGVRIWGRPFTSTGLAKNYAAHGSPIYPVGAGSGDGFFTITRGKVTITRIRFEIWDANQTTRLFRGFIPVNYQFK